MDLAVVATTTTVHDNNNCHTITAVTAAADRLVGLVVKASASRAGGPGFQSR